jgi:hypothetical protein
MASTMISGRAVRSSSSAPAATATPSVRALSAFSCHGSTTTTSSGTSRPAVNQPDSIARPILPQPTNTTLMPITRFPFAAHLHPGRKMTVMREQKTGIKPGDRFLPR